MKQLLYIPNGSYITFKSSEGNRRVPLETYLRNAWWPDEKRIIEEIVNFGIYYSEFYSRNNLPLQLSVEMFEVVDDSCD